MNTYLIIGGIILVVVICYYSMSSSQESVKTDHQKVQVSPKIEIKEGDEYIGLISPTNEKENVKPDHPKIEIKEGDEYIGLISPTNDKEDWFKKHHLYRRIIDNKAYYYITLHTDERTPISIPYNMGNQVEEENLKIDDVIIPKKSYPFFSDDAEYTLEKLN